MCGDHSLKNVVIATTMWDDVSEEAGQRAEDALRLHFQPALKQRATLVRHDNTAASVHQILRTTIFKNNPLPLSIQQEIVDDRKEDWNTSAGIELKRQLAALADELPKLENDPMRIQQVIPRIIKARENLEILRPNQPKDQKG
jgi:hypothetical protein